MSLVILENPCIWGVQLLWVSQKSLEATTVCTQYWKIVAYALSLKQEAIERGPEQTSKPWNQSLFWSRCWVLLYIDCETDLRYLVNSFIGCRYCRGALVSENEEQEAQGFRSEWVRVEQYWWFSNHARCHIWPVSSLWRSFPETFALYVYCNSHLN